MCDVCMSRITVVLRKELELEGFTRYLDYDFLRTDLKVDGAQLRGSRGTAVEGQTGQRY